MKVGIGITTTAIRSELLSFVVSKIRAFTKGYELFIYNDFEKKGVAYSKNKCLEALSDCDYVFLFDDDCFPTQEGWDKLFIEASNKTGNQHFCYMSETETIKKVKDDGLISTYNNCAGCLMFFTKIAISKAGMYNLSFGRYGFEHAEYSERINKLQLTASKYICPSGASDFIHSIDLNGITYQTPKHKLNLTADELIESVNHSRKVYNENTF